MKKNNKKKNLGPLMNPDQSFNLLPPAPVRAPVLAPVLSGGKGGKGGSGGDTVGKGGRGRVRAGARDNRKTPQIGTTKLQTLKPVYSRLITKITNTKNWYRQIIKSKPVYSRLLNKNIEYSEIKKLSYIPGLNPQEAPKRFKSLKSIKRIVLGIRKFNQNFNKLSRIDKLNAIENKSGKMFSSIAQGLVFQKPTDRLRKPGDSLFVSPKFNPAQNLAPASTLIPSPTPASDRPAGRPGGLAFGWSGASQERSVSERSNQWGKNGLRSEGRGGWKGSRKVRVMEVRPKQNNWFKAYFEAIEKKRIAKQKELKNIRIVKAIRAKKISNYFQKIYNFDQDIALSQNIVYNFNKALGKKFKLNSILENSFYTLKSLIGTPVYYITPHNITINLSYYASFSKSKIYYLKLKNNSRSKIKLYNLILKYLCVYISKKIKKPVELELLKISHPTLDSKIYTDALGLHANDLKKKRRATTFSPLARTFLRKTKILNPSKFRDFLRLKKLSQNRGSHMTGIRIKFGGRLNRQKLVPKRTSKTLYAGSLSRIKTNLVTTSRFSAISRRGAYSVTITMGHKFF